MTMRITVAGVSLTLAALANVEETGTAVAADLDSLRSGLLTSAALLDACLDGAADDREQGWRDYVSALSAHLAAEEPAPALDPLAAALVGWTGSAEQTERLRAFARDHAWEGPIADADYAAGEVVSALVDGIEPHPEALARLRSYLVESAEKCTAPAGDRSPVLVDGLADLRTWIANVDPCGAISGLGDVTAEERGAAVGQFAAAIREEDHPAWGSDWGPWLAEHGERITGEWLATGAA